MILGKFVGDSVVTASEHAFSLYDKSSWGEKKEGKIEYSNFEALALLKGNILEIRDKNKKISHEGLLKKLKRKDKRIEVKEIVFENLRKKGYIVKTGLKFGADFRVYNKGQKPGKDHAYWLIHVVKENEQINWYEFAARNRVATSTRKKLIMAIVDQEKGITYYELSWLKP